MILDPVGGLEDEAILGLEWPPHEGSLHLERDNDKKEAKRGLF